MRESSGEIAMEVSRSLVQSTDQQAEAVSKIAHRRSVIRKLCLYSCLQQNSSSGAVQTIFPVPIENLQLMEEGQRNIDQLQVDIIAKLIQQVPDTTASTAVFIHSNKDFTPEMISGEGSCYDDTAKR